jgi:hypothetical protein
MGSNLFTIFPGSLKSESWNQVGEVDRRVFLGGQGCIYHLQGGFTEKLDVKWVPFWQPQSVVKDPPVSSLWNLFRNLGADDENRCISFFQLEDYSKLPAVLNLLINTESRRSEKLSELVDWFGFYSSPLTASRRAGCMLYTRRDDKIQKFHDFEKVFSQHYQNIHQILYENPTPRAALKILSSHIPL